MKYNKKVSKLICVGLSILSIISMLIIKNSKVESYYSIESSNIYDDYYSNKYVGYIFDDYNIPVNIYNE